MEDHRVVRYRSGAFTFGFLSGIFWRLGWSTVVAIRRNVVECWTIFAALDRVLEQCSRLERRECVPCLSRVVVPNVVCSRLSRSSVGLRGSDIPA